jgi:hypothetical protein
MSGGKREPCLVLHRPTTASLELRPGDGAKKPDLERGFVRVFQNFTVFPPPPTQLALRSEEEAGGRSA